MGVLRCFRDIIRSFMGVQRDMEFQGCSREFKERSKSCQGVSRAFQRISGVFMGLQV